MCCTEDERNVYDWLANDEGLYELAKEALAEAKENDYRSGSEYKAGAILARNLREVMYDASTTPDAEWWSTPDGVPVTPELAQTAIDDLFDEEDDNDDE